MEMEIEMEPSIISLAKANITTPPRRRRRRRKLFPVVKIKSLHQFHHHLNQSHPIPTQVVFQEPVFLCRAWFFFFILKWMDTFLFLAIKTTKKKKNTQHRRVFDFVLVLMYFMWDFCGVFSRCVCFLL